MTQNKIAVFDLDDTLYNEIDYVTSGFSYISSQINLSHDVTIEMIENFKLKKNALLNLINKYNLNIRLNDLITLYRNHFPQIQLSNEVIVSLSELSKSCKLGIITDGRSISQRNKIKALNLNQYFKNENIVISDEIGYEKPSDINYLFFRNKYPNSSYYYIGDNLKKDFITPNRLGWTTICLLNNGRNIHEQNFDLTIDYLPKYTVENFIEIKELIQK